jgi:hypothetical protein
MKTFQACSVKAGTLNLCEAYAIETHSRLLTGDSIAAV